MRLSTTLSLLAAAVMLTAASTRLYAEDVALESLDLGAMTQGWGSPHAAKSVAAVNEIVHKQDTPRDLATGQRDVRCDIQFSLLRTGRLTVAAGRQNAQGLLENTRNHVTNAHPAPGETNDCVESPARPVNSDRQPLDQLVVFVPVDPKVAVRALGLRHCVRI